MKNTFFHSQGELVRFNLAEFERTVRGQLSGQSGIETYTMQNISSRDYKFTLA